MNLPLTIYQPTSGGKAGKGHNRTSSLQVRDSMNCVVKEFRYKLEPGEEVRALIKARKFIADAEKGEL